MTAGLLAGAGLTSAQQSDSAWPLGELDPNLQYEVHLKVNNRCGWPQNVVWRIHHGGSGITWRVTGPERDSASVPGSKVTDVTIDSGLGKELAERLNGQRIEIDHLETAGPTRVCLEEHMAFTFQVPVSPTSGAGPKGPPPGTAALVVGGAIIELDEIAKTDRTVPRVSEGGKSGVLPGGPDPRAEGDGDAKKRHGSRGGVKKWPYLVGGGVAAVAGVVALSGGGGGGTPPASSTPSLPLPPPPSGALFCGTYTGQLEPTQVACGFSTAFPMRFALTCSSSGSAQLVISRADNDPQGQRFEYTGTISPAGVLDFSGSGNLRGLATYTGHFTGVITGNGTTLEGTNTVIFTEPGCQGQTLVQRITGTRAN